MVVSMPRNTPDDNGPRDMVRVQLKPNDVRSYTRKEAEELIKTTPGAFIVGEQEAEHEFPSPDSSAKAQKAAPNKARQTAASKGKDA